MNTDTHTSTDRRILADQAYSIGELAAALDTGRRCLYKAVREGDLRAATINDRGDLRVLGQWALAYLDGRVLQRAEV